MSNLGSTYTVITGFQWEVMRVVIYKVHKVLCTLCSLKMRQMNTEFGKQSLIFRGPVVWNSLSENIRKPVNINQFKAAIKKCKAMDDVSFIKGTCTNKNKNF